MALGGGADLLDVLLQELVQIGTGQSVGHRGEAAQRAEAHQPACERRPHVSGA